MNTNGFALFIGDEAATRAQDSAERVKRRCERVETRTVEGPAGDGGRVVAFSLEGEGSATFPLVHGFVNGEGGEFAFVKQEGAGFAGGRDILGTRGLYVDAGWTCVASDHRFFPSRPRLLPSGSQFQTNTKKVSVTGIASEPSGLTIEEASQRLASLLSESVKARVAGRKKVAVSFSGGLDSSLLALLASKETQVLLCSAFAEGSRDQEQTRKAAEVLGLELLAKEVGPSEVVEEVRSVDLPFQPGEMDLALWTMYSTTSRSAAENGAELILLGQLADELFGGYMKYALAARRAPEDVESMMWADVAACGTTAFIRDEMACARFSEARFPFADESIARFAFGLPLHYKISGGERKVVLRKAASLLGLPDSLTNAPKKAAQYSSGIAKLVR